jgi:hypothetical protein
VLDVVERRARGHERVAGVARWPVCAAARVLELHGALGAVTAATVAAGFCGGWGAGRRASQLRRRTGRSRGWAPATAGRPAPPATRAPDRCPVGCSGSNPTTTTSTTPTSTSRRTRSAPPPSSWGSTPRVQTRDPAGYVLSEWMGPNFGVLGYFNDDAGRRLTVRKFSSPVDFDSSGRTYTYDGFGHELSHLLGEEPERAHERRRHLLGHQHVRRGRSPPGVGVRPPGGRRARGGGHVDVRRRGAAAGATRRLGPVDPIGLEQRHHPVGVRRARAAHPVGGWRRSLRSATGPATCASTRTTTAGTWWSRRT